LQPLLLFCKIQALTRQEIALTKMNMMTDYLIAEETAEKFGITVERLYAILNRKDCPKGIINDEGKFNVEAVGKFLAKLKKVNDKLREFYRQKKEGKAVEAPQHTKETKKAAKKASKKAKPAGQCNGTCCKIPNTSPAKSEAPKLTYDEFRRKFWEQNRRWELAISGIPTREIMTALVADALEYGYSLYRGENPEKRRSGWIVTTHHCHCK
jgi:hypothetical protein